MVLDLTAEDDAVVIPQPSAVSGQLGQGGAGPGPSSALAQEVAAQQADVQRLFAAAVIRREQARVAALAHLSGSKRRRSGSLTWEERAPMQPPPAEGPKCAVCLEAYREPACGPCRHVFCRECLMATLKTTKKCPTCRKNMHPKQVHRIYL